jgi:hypothetical protein
MATGGLTFREETPAMPQLPYQYVTPSVMVTVMSNGIEWMEKGLVTGGPREFVPASDIAGVVEDAGGLVSPARLEIRFKTRPALSLSAQVGHRSELHALKDAIVSIMS